LAAINGVVTVAHSWPVIVLALTTEPPAQVTTNAA
jgi:hypothetical protein